MKMKPNSLFYYRKNFQNQLKVIITFYVLPYSKTLNNNESLLAYLSRSRCD